MNVIDEHIAALLLEWVKLHGGGHKSTFTPSSASESLWGQLGLKVDASQTARVLDDLAAISIAQKFHSPLTDGFYELSRDHAIQLFGAPGWSDAKVQPVARDKAADEKYPILNTYLKSDPSWAGFALAALAKEPSLLEIASRDDELGVHVPAADRIVTLSHNQQVELDNISTDLVDAVEKENSIDGDSSVRMQLIGQLKAGRELIRAQTLSAYLLYETLISALGHLIKKYKGHAIGETAKQLWALLLRYIFTGT